MALKAGRVGVNPNYVDKEGRPLYDNSYLKELLRKEGIITLFTKEGNPITIDNAVAGRVYDLAVTMAPKQAGTGTPSPTNVREISGYTGLTITVNGTDVEVDFDETVYGGTADVTGEGASATQNIIDLGSLTWNIVSATAGVVASSTTISNAVNPVNNAASVQALCSHFEVLPFYRDGVPGHDANSTDNSIAIWASGGAGGPANCVYIRSLTLANMSAAEVKAALNGVQFLYKLTTPTSIPLTAQNISLNTGTNTISSDTGTTMDIKYLGTLVPGGANGRSLNRSLNLNREVIDGEERKEIQEEIKEEVKEVPVEEPVTTKKSTKKSTK